MKEDKFVSLFHEGNTIDAYKFFGAHKTSEGVTFTVYAPHARNVSIIGTFTGWHTNPLKLSRSSYPGIWKGISNTAILGDKYKYKIEDSRGNILEKSDPYAFQAEYDGEHASIIADINYFSWHDEKWLEERNLNFDKPINIYEIYAGGWKKDALNKCSYRYLQNELLPYLIENKYTHVEFMPLNEHPFDGSWGYQASGYFALTSRYGSLRDFVSFVDACHQNGIGVIMDIVPVHFVKDMFGLSMFDGEALYEYPNSYESESPWGTLNFHLGKDEVRSFLMSACAFWCDVYHIDGLRIDAVSNMIFYNGDKRKGINQEGLAFLKRLNYRLHERFSSVMMIAEDSSDYRGVTEKIENGGLGFDYKWDLGWMNDTLHYLSLEPLERSFYHGQIAFSMAYYYSERFLLPLSHDENVHGKKSILEKMYGDYDTKFALARLLYGYMYCHPGKKLNFMGNEIGMFREFDEKRELDWMLLEYPMHQKFKKYMQTLNTLYLKIPALYQEDYNRHAFHYLNDRGSEGFAFQRKIENSCIMFLMNPSNENITMCFDSDSDYRVILNSDDIEFGGKSTVYPCHIEAINHKICIALAANSCVILER